jgi:site-specific DNA-methyltransferase (adenine-specific)
MSKIELIHGDCLIEMQNIPDKSIDAIVTDCPYKIVSGGCTKKPFKGEMSGIMTHRRTEKRTDWVDDVRSGKMFKHNNLEFSDWLPQLYRVAKENSHTYIMINSRNLSNLEVEARKVGFKFQNLLIWDKGNVTPNKWYMQGFECILMLKKGAAKNINNLGTSNIIRVQNIIGKKVHPTEKPHALMEILIGNSTKENQIILDPFMGSGSTGVAAQNLNRSFIGIEMDDKYFEIAEKRINNAKQTLFSR